MARGEFKLPAPASKMARFVFGALQGALLVKRTTNDLSQIERRHRGDETAARSTILNG